MAIPTNPFSGIIEQTPDPFLSFARFRVWRNPRLGRIEIQHSRDSGVTWKTLLPEPPTNPQSGLVLALDARGEADWRSPALTPAAVAASSGGPLVAGVDVVYADLNYAGVLADESSFGFYMAPTNSSIRCFGTQVSLQCPAVGGNTVIDIVDEYGNEKSRLSTIPEGMTGRQTIFGTPLTMLAGTSWCLRIKQVAPTDPGQFLGVRLILAA